MRLVPGKKVNQILVMSQQPDNDPGQIEQHKDVAECNEREVHVQNVENYAIN